MFLMYNSLQAKTTTQNNQSFSVLNANYFERVKPFFIRYGELSEMVM